MSMRLPDWAEDIAGRVVSTCRDDPRLLGVSIGGSGAAGAMDEFSDLDVVIVCTDDARDEILARAGDLAAKLGPLLASFTAEHLGDPRLRICLFGPPLRHVDLKFVTLGELAERVEDGALIWTRDKQVEEALRSSPPAWPAPAPQWLEDRFWVWAHYTATKIGRGELFEALDALSFMRASVLGPLVALARGRPPQGVRRIEQYAPDLVPELEATVAGHDPAACASALEATIRLYLRLRAEGTAPPTPHRAAEAAVVAYLDEISDAVARDAPV